MESPCLPLPGAQLTDATPVLFPIRVALSSVLPEFRERTGA
jgi:hypothetical protein